MTSIKSVALFTVEPEADALLAVLAAVTGAETIPWRQVTLLDGSESRAAQLNFDGGSISITVGNTAMPAVLALEVPDPAGAIDAAEVAGATVLGSGMVTDSVRIGHLRIRLTEAA